MKILLTVILTVLAVHLINIVVGMIFNTDSEVFAAVACGLPFFITIGCAKLIRRLRLAYQRGRYVVCEFSYNQNVRLRHRKIVKKKDLKKLKMYDNFEGQKDEPRVIVAGKGKEMRSLFNRNDLFQFDREENQVFIR